jgi:hypothetical protein
MTPTLTDKERRFLRALAEWIGPWGNDKHEGAYRPYLDARSAANALANAAAAETPKEPRPHNPCGYTGGVCHCDVCMAPNAAPRPEKCVCGQREGERSTFHEPYCNLAPRPSEGSKSADIEGCINMAIFEIEKLAGMPSDCARKALRQALRQYREERAASERAISSWKKEEIIWREMMETIGRERDEARERIEKADDEMERVISKNDGRAEGFGHVLWYLRGADPYKGETLPHRVKWRAILQGTDTTRETK